MPYLEIVTVLILTLVNGLLAMSELAIASSRAPRLRLMAEQGVKGARRALALAADPGRFLSTVQIGITLIGIIAGVVSGASLVARFSVWLETAGIPPVVAESLGFGLVIGGITYLSLVIGELVPKQIALRNPERIACLVAPAMTILAKVSAPVVWLLQNSGQAVLAVLGQSKRKDETVTDAEIHSIIAEAESAGVIEPEERDMIAGVMRLGDRIVRSVMVPRTDVKMVSITETLAAIGKLLAESGHSRLVVHDGSQNNIIGVIEAKDIAAAALRKRSLNIKSFIKKAPSIPDTVDALDVVTTLKDSNVHIGLVYDEHGDFEGIVTSADILEAIVGAFREEKREVEPEFVERSDGSWLVAGWAPVDTITQKLALPLPELREYQTMAGFVLDRIGHLPQAGESFEERGYHYEVVDLDGKRIDKILVQRSAAATRRAFGQI